MRIKVAGFGGQGVLMLGEVLAEAGLDAGSKFPGCPPTGRRCAPAPRTVTCGSRRAPVDSPLVSRPNVLLALNEPSLHKFIDYGGTRRLGSLQRRRAARRRCHRADVNLIVKPFTELADAWATRAPANIVMLGALARSHRHA